MSYSLRRGPPCLRQRHVCEKAPSCLLAFGQSRPGRWNARRLIRSTTFLCNSAYEGLHMQQRVQAIDLFVQRANS